MSNITKWAGPATLGVTNKPQDYCPHCGGELTAVDPPTTHRCEDCERLSFYNPTPSARVVVVDGDEMLLCEVGVEGVKDTWETPGGRLEADEDPPVAAARELSEETGLTVDPAELSPFDVRASRRFPASIRPDCATPSSGQQPTDRSEWARNRTASASGRPRRSSAMGWR